MKQLNTTPTYFAVRINGSYYVTEARSDYHAARIIKDMTGEMVEAEKDVAGPFYDVPQDLLEAPVSVSLSLS